MCMLNSMLRCYISGLLEVHMLFKDLNLISAFISSPSSRTLLIASTRGEKEEEEQPLPTSFKSEESYLVIKLIWLLILMIYVYILVQDVFFLSDTAMLLLEICCLLSQPSASMLRKYLC